MKPLPVALLQQREALPEDTCRIVLNTNRYGNWDVEFTVRYHFREPRSDAGVDAVPALLPQRLKASKTRY